MPAGEEREDMESKTIGVIGLGLMGASLCKALEIIGGSTGFESAAPEHARSAGLDRFGDGLHLILRLHGAGSCNNLEMTAAEGHLVRYPDHGVIRMELPVRLLERLRNPGHALDNVQSADQVCIDPGGITHQSDNCLEFTF